MPAILETQGLTRRFGRFTAVDGLDLRVEEGDLFGFLGPNGAGKTTTMRMCLGLIRPSAGSVKLFGEDLHRNFLSVMRRVGALVELPAYYPHLSARKNLEILRLATGGVDRKRIDEVLGQVGLEGRLDEPVRTYSQGMRQRLGIAMALLPDPRLVLLDEPINGLDPHGISRIRQLILDLNRTKGVTFLISSHLLHEIEITCNRVAIVKGGRLLEQNTVAGLLAKTGWAVRVEAEPLDRALEVARAVAGAEAVAPGDDGSFTVRIDAERRAGLVAELVKAGVAVSGIVPERLSLEEYFLKL